MGRYNLAARNVHVQATKLLRAGQLKAPPAWFNAVGSIPTSEVLTRKPMQKKPSKSRRASRMYKPAHLEHPEDKLRWEFFNDHPWELARPRVVLENDGRDYTKWDWSHALCRPQAVVGDAEVKRAVEIWDQKQLLQSARPLNGEAVVQRQQWLMHNEGLTEAAAYDKARKEFYRTRHMQEVQQRVAREECTFYGGFFGKSALEVGMDLEDRAFEEFRKYAETRLAERRQKQSAAYTEGPEQHGEEEADDEEDGHMALNSA